MCLTCLGSPGKMASLGGGGVLSVPMVCPRDAEQKPWHGMPRQRAAATTPTPPPTPRPLHTQVFHGSCRRSGNELRERDHRGAADLKGARAGGHDAERMERLGAASQGPNKTCAQAWQGGIFDGQRETHYISLGLGTAEQRSRLPVCTDVAEAALSTSVREL